MPLNADDIFVMLPVLVSARSILRKLDQSSNALATLVKLDASQLWNDTSIASDCNVVKIAWKLALLLNSSGASQ